MYSYLNKILYVILNGLLMKYVTSAVNKFKLSKNLLIYCFVFLICGFSTSYLFTFDSYVYTTASIQVFLDRPIIIPLFNLLMLDNPVLIVIAQSIIFALSLYYFAKNISRLIENRYYKNLLFFMIILFSFSYSIIRWTNAIESESYCMSAGLLFMALLFSKRNHNNLLVWSLVLIFYIFTRDTNTYMLIFLLPIIYYKLRTNKKLCFQVIIIAICLVLINVFMCLKSELRSGEPMRNNYQSRVFLNDELTEHFHETYGMPIPPHQNYVGNLYQIYNILPDYQPKFNSYTRLDQGFNPPDYLQLYNFSESKIIANPEFESWFKLYGKKSFTNYLIVNGFFLKDVFTKYYNFIFFMPQLNNYNYNLRYNYIFDNLFKSSFTSLNLIN